MNTNARATIGDNTKTIDFAKDEIERLARDYAELENSFSELEAEAEPIVEIEDNDAKGVVTSLIKRIRDATKRAEGFRELEKQPHFRRGQGVDQFFFGLTDRLSKRNKRDRDGIGDRLQTMLTVYDNRMLMEEQARRRAEAERLAKIERDRIAEAKRLEDKAEAERLAAERARVPEQIAKKEQVAAGATVLANEAKIDATLATDAAQAAHIETLAKPGDIMRHRGTDGTLSTMAREGYAEVVDQSKLDKDALWPFLLLDAKEKALRSWAKTNGYTVQMTGAAVGFRNKSVVR